MTSGDAVALRPPTGRVRHLIVAAAVVAALLGAAVAVGSAPARATTTTTKPGPGGPGDGYWLVAGDGGVFSFGPGIPFYGSEGGHHLSSPIVDMVATPDGGGYWLVAGDGGVFTFGDAGFFGSAAGTRLPAPIVDMVATPDGRGYWLLDADGQVINFGDATFHGDPLGQLRSSAVAMARNPAGTGYWILDQSGDIVAENVPTEPSVVVSTSDPAVGLAETADGGGDWVASRTGQVWSSGDAPVLGEISGPLNAPIVSLTATPDGGGYWLLGQDGGVFTYGDAAFYGSTGSEHLNAPVLGLAPWRPATPPSPTPPTTPPTTITTPTTATTPPTTTNLGAGQSGTVVDLSPGDSVVVSLPTCPDCGDNWALRSGPDPEVLQFESSSVEPGGTAGGETQVFRFVATGAGSTTPVLWEYPPGPELTESPDNTYTFTATVSS